MDYIAGERPVEHNTIYDMLRDKGERIFRNIMDYITHSSSHPYQQISPETDQRILRRLNRKPLFNWSTSTKLGVGTAMILLLSSGARLGSNVLTAMYENSTPPPIVLTLESALDDAAILNDSVIGIIDGATSLKTNYE